MKGLYPESARECVLIFPLHFLRAKYQKQSLPTACLLRASADKSRNKRWLEQ